MAELAAGTLIDGKYRIVRPLGEGGMGTVYVAEHQFLRKQVALKVLRAELATNAEVSARFLREARAASGIDHEHVVRVLDSGTAESGQLYLVMELLEGRALFDELAETPRLPVARTLVIADGILRGLEAAHACGVVHRDLKPDNIFLARRDGGEVVKLVDFGIARVREKEGTRLTTTGAVLGTPLYMAPEQVSGEETDARVDIHAVGVILYEMLAGRTPYQGATFGAISHEILSGNPPHISSLAPHVPPALAAVIMRALASAKAARFASAREMRLALEAVVASPTPLPVPARAEALAATMQAFPPPPRPVTSRNVGLPEREAEPDLAALELDRGPAPSPSHSPARARGRGPLAAILGVVVIAAAGAGAWLTLGQRTSPPPARVHIEVLDLPPGARVFVDNVRTEPAFDLPGARDQHRLRIEARGYATRLELFTPDASQTIDGHLERAK